MGDDGERLNERMRFPMSALSVYSPGFFGVRKCYLLIAEHYSDSLGWRKCCRIHLVLLVYKSLKGPKSGDDAVTSHRPGSSYIIDSVCVYIL